MQSIMPSMEKKVEVKMKRAATVL